MHCFSFKPHIQAHSLWIKYHRWRHSLLLLHHTSIGYGGFTGKLRHNYRQCANNGYGCATFIVKHYSMHVAPPWGDHQHYFTCETYHTTDHSLLLRHVQCTVLSLLPYIERHLEAFSRTIWYFRYVVAPSGSTMEYYHLLSTSGTDSYSAMIHCMIHNLLINITYSSLVYIAMPYSICCGVCHPRTHLFI